MPSSSCHHTGKGLSFLRSFPLRLKGVTQFNLRTRKRATNHEPLIHQCVCMCVSFDEHSPFSRTHLPRPHTHTHQSKHSFWFSVSGGCVGVMARVREEKSFIRISCRPDMREHHHGSFSRQESQILINTHTQYSVGYQPVLAGSGGLHITQACV